MSRHVGVAWTAIYPWTERPHRMNISGRNCIHQRRIIAPWRIWAHVTHHNVAQNKLLRIFVRLRCLDHKLRVIALDLVHDDLDLAKAPVTLWNLLTDFARWNTDGHLVYVNSAHV